MEVGEGVVVSGAYPLKNAPSVNNWNEVKEIIHEALRIDVGARAEYLDNACHGNVDLRTEVESLLSSMIDAHSFLEQPAVGDATTIGNNSRLNIGEQISHYKIVSHIASGGMGEVYLAEDQNLRRKVALKVLSGQLLADSDQIRRFRREANAVSALNHPNILTIFEFDSANGINLLVTEFVEGETLRERIRRGRLTVPEAMGIAVQIATALEAAHGAEIIHRDIKPENIMIRADGFVKVLDFGLAKLNKTGPPDEDAETLLQVLSRPGMIMGTAKYMSPEQARAQQIDQRSDIFSLGVVLYEMLTGEPPFTGETTADVIVSILQNEAPRLRVMNADVLEELESIVKKALSKDAADRYQKAAELLVELKGIQKKLDRDETLGDSEQTPISNGPSDSGGEISLDSFLDDRDALIGRNSEIADVIALLRRNDVQLVTLTGIGGTGKTRLARAVTKMLGREFVGGSAFVELSCFRDPDLVISAIAQSLGIPEVGGSDVLETIRSEMREKPVLLVLDNLEQVIASATKIAELISGLPGSKILATSRELLHLSMEVEYAVPPLGVPSVTDGSIADDLRRSESVILFEKRARKANSDFVITDQNAFEVAEICSRLDGLPLAIELAAARAKLLSPSEILAKLDDRFSLLTGGAKDLPDRQRTVRGAIEWSYDLLSDEEKDIFRRLSVFAGGFTPTSAESVLINAGFSSPLPERRETGGSSSGDRSILILDLITSLSDKSLIVPRGRHNGELRFGFLNTVREYGAAALSETDHSPTMQRCHSEYFLELAETAEPHLKGADSAVWLRRLETDHENIRAALRWSIDNAPDIAARIAAAIRNLWTIHGRLHEGSRWSAEILSRDPDIPDQVRWKILTGYGNLSQFLGDVETAHRIYEESLAVSNRTGDKIQISQSLRGLAALAYMRSEFEPAKALIEKAVALSRESNDEFGLAASLARLADIANAEDDFTTAATLSAESLRIYRELEYKEGISSKLNNLGAAEFALGNFEESRKCFDEALTVAIELGEKINTRLIFDGFGALAAQEGNFRLAAQFSGVAETLGASIGYAPEPSERRFRDAYVIKVKEAMGEYEYADAYNAGLKLSLEEATKLARE